MKRKKQRKVLANLQRGQHRNEKAFFVSYESKDLKQTREKTALFPTISKMRGARTLPPSHIYPSWFVPKRNPDAKVFMQCRNTLIFPVCGSHGCRYQYLQTWAVWNLSFVLSVSRPLSSRHTRSFLSQLQPNLEFAHELVIPHAHLPLIDAPPQYIILAESRDTHHPYGFLLFSKIESKHSYLMNCSQCEETLVRLASWDRLAPV